MKTINQLLKRKTALLKYIMLSVFVYMTTCGQEAGCTGGPSAPPPPDPEFNISYNFVDENNAKIYFSPDQIIVIHQIYVQQPQLGISQVIKFSYPFIECGYEQVHFLNQYNIPVKGKEWQFQFSGVSKSIRRSFTVNVTKTIQ